MKGEVGASSSSSADYPEWTREENKLFENAIALLADGETELWEKLLLIKTPEQLQKHYQALIEDVEYIESGRAPIPHYPEDDEEELEDECMDVDVTRTGNASNAARDTRVMQQERKRGIPWTEDEHRMFLLGLQKYGKGDWRSISRNFVKSRTPTQVASHAQKYFNRQNSSETNGRRRPSIHDIRINVTGPTPPPPINHAFALPSINHIPGGAIQAQNMLMRRTKPGNLIVRPISADPYGVRENGPPNDRMAASGSYPPGSTMGNLPGDPMAASGSYPPGSTMANLSSDMMAASGSYPPGSTMANLPSDLMAPSGSYPPGSTMANLPSDVMVASGSYPPGPTMANLPNDGRYPPSTTMGTRDRFTNFRREMS